MIRLHDKVAQLCCHRGLWCGVHKISQPF